MSVPQGIHSSIPVCRTLPGEALDRSAEAEGSRVRSVSSLGMSPKPEDCPAIPVTSGAREANSMAWGSIRL